MFLSTFECTQDKDIEYLLHNRAVEFEKLSKARTYLVCSQRQLENDRNVHNLKIYGYISIALKILSVPESISNRIRKELDGFSAKIHGEKINDFPCYLIGQLSKNFNIPENNLSGRQLIEFASDVIAASVDAVGGRYMMIECRDNEKLLQFYKENHFSEIAKIPDDGQSMVQMIRKIY